MIEFLFLDLDDTILDFHKAERIAMAKTLKDFGIEPAESVLSRYHVINKLHWEKLERKELDREGVLVGRFQMLFRELGVDTDARAVRDQYEQNLGIGHYFLPGAEEAVKSLSKKYRLFLASNGTASVQHSRLTSANLYRWFEDVFVSQDIGHNKPSVEYFEGCFARIHDFDPKKAMMVGDSLTSDMLGGIQAGMSTCWINHDNLPAPSGIRPDYTLSALSELEALLDRIEAEHERIY